MYWTPYQLSDMKAMNDWFEQKKILELSILKNMKSFFKSLFFDRTIVKNVKAQSISKEKLNLFLQDGKISMQEYLFLSR